ncbi:MAG: endo-1,4-beta-xylanase [Kaiparowitsia implicata GSE-PSE-MK54-09C]|jgi:endo-1,4-beta-xylanase|nr:endo-1,4-beta-xylanase [Kaiparowitsia implicata GSE-PSE-MK54-09C]
MKRRDLLLGLGATSAVAAVALNRKFNTNQASPAFALASDRSFNVQGDRSLRERARDKGILYGAEIQISNLREDPEFRDSVLEECDILVPGYDWKWRPLRPSVDEFDFEKSDDLVAFAEQHNRKLRGHALVWHESMPDWFEETATRSNAEALLQNHIQTVASRYAGKVHSWDVVNEAIEPWHNLPGEMRRTPWLELLGVDYIEMAFRFAHEADPGAVLVYNDFRLEFENDIENRKRDAVLTILERLKSRDVPIHALGMQAHLNADEFHTFNPDRLRAFMDDVTSLGLKLMVTELDVIDRRLPADVDTRDRMVASVYEDYLSVVLENTEVTTVMTWGLSDRRTWLSGFRPREDGLGVRPLPLDEDLERKPAWNAIARAFDNAPPRDNPAIATLPEPDCHPA